MTGSDLMYALGAVGCGVAVGLIIGTVTYGITLGSWTKPQNRNYRR